MKKLIGILILMFITTGVFGQKFIRDWSRIQPTPTGNTAPQTVEDWLHVGGNNGDYSWVRHVHFVKNERLYILAYEPLPYEIFKKGVDRKVFLYSKDINDINSPWIEASPVLLISTWQDINNYNEVDFSRSDLSRGSVGQVIFEGEVIKITIGYEVMSNGGFSSKPMTFILKPTGDGKYRVSHDTYSSLQ